MAEIQRQSWDILKGQTIGELKLYSECGKTLIRIMNDKGEMLFECSADWMFDAKGNYFKEIENL